MAHAHASRHLQCRVHSLHSFMLVFTPRLTSSGPHAQSSLSACSALERSRTPAMHSIILLSCPSALATHTPHFTTSHLPPEVASPNSARHHTPGESQQTSHHAREPLSTPHHTPGSLYTHTHTRRDRTCRDHAINLHAIAQLQRRAHQSLTHMLTLCHSQFTPAATL